MFGTQTATSEQRMFPIYYASHVGGVAVYDIHARRTNGKYFSIFILHFLFFGILLYIIAVPRRDYFGITLPPEHTILAAACGSNKKPG